MTRFVAFSVAGLALLGICSACRDDPYSRRRIQSRVHHLTETTDDIEAREASGVRRLDEADETFRKWWRSDSERFNRRVPTIGDYIW